MYPKAIIKQKKSASIKRKHPWVFSGAVLDNGNCTNGDLAELFTEQGEFLGIGYYQNSSIMFRVISFEKHPIDLDFWIRKIHTALMLRKKFNLPGKETNAFRLFHAEGDGISGLIIDLYDNLAVIQCHSIFVHKSLENIKKALLEVCPFINTIYNKSKAVLPKDYANSVQDGFIEGSLREAIVMENGNSFIINVVSGQKTGFFLDQRENRALLAQYAKQKSVLNLFSYTGGFSIYAINAGAKSVCSIDISSIAIEMLDRNVQLTTNPSIHTSKVKDVNKYLKEIPENYYDLIVVDPPAFAKNIRKKHNAVQAYKRVNVLALKKLKKNGIIFSFSCSQVIDNELFINTIRAAAIESKREIKIIHFLSQGPDHPISIYHPEGRYLKGLVLYVQ